MLSTCYTYENENQISIDVKCSICFDPFQLPLQDVYCGHMFCFQCIKTWLKRKQSCPICRQYFTKFVRINNERILRELDQLNVQCLYCNKTNIKRCHFHDHMTNECSKQMLIDQEEMNERFREHFNIDFLLKRLNESMENNRTHQYYHEQTNPISLPIWVLLISGFHLVIYISVLIPSAILLNIGDICIYLVHRIITFLARLIKFHI